MTFSKSTVRTLLTASRRYALMAGVCAATCGFVACGSDSKTKTSTGTTTGSTAGATTGTTTAGTTTGSTTSGGTDTSGGTQDCTPSGNSSFTNQSTGVTLTPAGGGAAVAMPYVLFINNPNATDVNKKYAVSVFDYDYCAFSADHGYKTWPITGFHAASFFLVDAANTATSFAQGNYTVGGSTQSIYVSATAGSYGSGVTITQAGGGGASCVGKTYPTLNSGGTVDITSTPGAGTNAIAGVTGTFNVVLSDGSTLSGPFTSGSCTAGTMATPPTPDMCACSL